MLRFILKVITYLILLTTAWPLNIPPPISSTEKVPQAIPTIAPHQPEFAVRFHPDGPLYIGDLVSLEITSPPASSGSAPIDYNHDEIRVQVDSPEGASFGPARFNPTGEFGQYRATLQWAWDTHGLVPGQHTLIYTINPGGLSWQQTVTLEPENTKPAPELNSKWAETRTNCCILHYMTGTAAARDLAALETLANEETLDVTAQLHGKLKTPIEITFLPRTLGQGGFTANQVEVSYLDRNYAGSTINVILHHEIVHAVDAQLGGELRPDLLAEGLAVYLTGGHFKPDPMLPDVAALLGMGWYIPLPYLADNFYPTQHEIGYIEGAAFITYLVNTYGWDAFSAFYRDIHPQSSHRQSDAINAALQAHFGLTFAQAEDRFINSLHQQAIIPDLRTDIALTVSYYDTMRRYQQLMDPSAYFRDVWLPDPVQMQKRGIVADYLRHPDSPENQTLEMLLINAERNLRMGKYNDASQGISVINQVLDAVQNGKNAPYLVDPASADEYNATLLLDRCGDEPQQMTLGNTTGQATVIRTWPELQIISLMKTAGAWMLLQPCG